jgi:hypothetical protein
LFAKKLYHLGKQFVDKLNFSVVDKSLKLRILTVFTRRVIKAFSSERVKKKKIGKVVNKAFELSQPHRTNFCILFWKTKNCFGV